MYESGVSRIYLDNAATTSMSSKVRWALCLYLNNRMFGNPDSTHCYGRNASETVEWARGEVAKALRAKPENIIFTSGGSEGNNMIIKGAIMNEGKNAVAVSAVEHSSVFNSALNTYGENMLCIDVDEDGRVSPEQLDRLLSEQGDRVGLVSVMMMNNELGTVNDVRKLARIAHKHGALFHTDCVQSFGQQKIYPIDWYIDFLTVSAHKIHGMQGCGAIYVKDKSRLKPLVAGSDAQEFGLRGGTKNVPGILCFGVACSDIKEVYVPEEISTAFLRKLQNEMSKIPQLDGIMTINGESNNKILNLRFDGVDSETLLLLLDAEGVMVSSGSACHAHETKPSRVLSAIGLSDEATRQCIRVSFSNDNTVDEVERAASIIVKCLQVLHTIPESLS